MATKPPGPRRTENSHSILHYLRLDIGSLLVLQEAMPASELIDCIVYPNSPKAISQVRGLLPECSMDYGSWCTSAKVYSITHEEMQLVNELLGPEGVRLKPAAGGA